jgi:stearoyl-CoA desaturase (delta-9 desaturase)
MFVTQAAITVTSIYLHRGLAHRALSLAPPVTFACRFLIWITTGMKPREWAAVHRKHHAATDTEADPHSPMVHGFWRVQITNAALYRRAAREPSTVARYGRDLPGDRADRMFFDHAFAGLALGITMAIGISIALGFGWWPGLLASAIHAVSYLMLAGSINSVGHTYGTRPYPNSATNLRGLALVTAGEGLHNNHHAAPTSAKFALHSGEIDPSWWVIRALVGLHLAQVRHDDTKFVHAA